MSLLICKKIKKQKKVKIKGRFDKMKKEKDIGLLERRAEFELCRLS